MEFCLYTDEQKEKITMNILKCKKEISSERMIKLFSELYGEEKSVIEHQQNRYIKAIEEFKEHYPNREEIKIYSASGRTEIGGNHTDHQRGRVLAGAVNLDTVAIVSFHNEGVARVISEGYAPAEISLDDLEPNKADDGTQAIVRGVVSKFNENGGVFKRNEEGKNAFMRFINSIK